MLLLTLVVCVVERPINIPLSAGCYRFLDAGGRVLYIGKAKCLRLRLTSYFPTDKNVLHARTRAMLNEACSVTWVELANDEEALLTEAAQIRQLLPPYNVRLRDDHTYPSIVLSEHQLPRISVHHGSPPKTGVVFGPYPSPSHAKHLLEAIARTAGVRPCKDNVLTKHQLLQRQCLIGETGWCSAPCVNPLTYMPRVAQAKALLQGDVEQTVVTLRAKMNEAAACKAFEAAASHRDAIDAVTRLKHRHLPTAVNINVSAAGLAVDELGAAVSILIVRNETLIGCPTFVIDRALLANNNSVTPQVALSYALASAFSISQPPSLLVVSSIAPESTTLAALSVLAGGKVASRIPKRGPLKDLVDLATKNAASALNRARMERAADADTRRSDLIALAKEINLDGAPLRIECLDISHFQGSQTTAAFAVVDEGLVRASRHRIFHIDSGNNDGESMRVAVRARVQAWRDQAAKPAAQRDMVLAHLPQLLVVDGGPTQLLCVVQELAAQNVNVPAVALAKRLEEVFLPNQSVALRLPLDSPALYVLQRSRDAAHDASIRAQRKRRTKKLVASVLDDIPGLGAKRRERLLKEVGSQKKLEQLPQTSYPTWLPASVTQHVFNKLHPKI